MRKWLFLFFWMVVLITANAQPPAISFVVSNETVSENIGTYAIAVFITNADTVPVSIDINVSGGNATYGTNFTYSPVTVTFPANSPFTQTFNVNVIDDSIPDGNKYVVFSLANPVNGTIGTIAVDTLVMTDADTPVINLTSTSAQVAENTGNVFVGANLNRGVRGSTSVAVNLIPGGTTAVKGIDFVFNDTTLVWPADSDGVLNAVIGVINNSFYEHQRTVEVGITAATNGATTYDTTFTLTILANSGDTAPGCSDLFFGQYVEGSGNNKAIQIYNPTAVPIDLSVYSIVQSDNGGASKSQYSLSGTIAPLGVYVVANPGASTGILSIANATSSVINFDGTDALALLHLTDTIDVIGQLDTYPGTSGWAVGSGSTVQQTLIRSYYDHAGDTNWASASLTWNVYPVNMIDSLGFHHAESCSGQVPVATVRFLYSGDTISQTDTLIWIQLEVNNPTGSNVTFFFGPDHNASTAVEGYGNDYYQSNFYEVSPPGITYDSFYISIFSSAEVIPVKDIVFKVFNLSSNAVMIPDTEDIIYLVSDNKFYVSFLGAGYSYPKGSGLVEIPVITSTFSSQPTTVDVTLSAGNAVLGQDFLFNDTTITFPAFSDDTQGVWVTILNNNLYEANKQANFNLSNPSNGAILDITGFTLTIVNNDSLAGGVVDAGIDNDIKIMPNPVINSLVVQNEEELEDVIITDVLGKRIVNLGKFNAGSTSVNVSSLTSGIYFLTINSGDRIFCKKFIKTE